MNYWRFLSILNEFSIMNQRAAGLPVIRKGIPESSRDMIERRKAQR